VDAIDAESSGVVKYRRRRQGSERRCASRGRFAIAPTPDHGAVDARLAPGNARAGCREPRLRMDETRIRSSGLEMLLAPDAKVLRRNRPRRDRAASVKTRAAPPTARAARWAKCQSLAVALSSAGIMVLARRRWRVGEFGGRAGGITEEVRHWARGLVRLWAVDSTPRPAFQRAGLPIISRLQGGKRLRQARR